MNKTDVVVCLPSTILLNDNHENCLEMAFTQAQRKVKQNSYLRSKAANI